MLTTNAIPLLLVAYTTLGLIILALWPPCRAKASDFWVVAGALLVGLLRFSVPGHGFSWAGSYEALAHIVCGMLLVRAFQRDVLAGVCLALITVLECVMFACR